MSAESLKKFLSSQINPSEISIVDVGEGYNYVIDIASPLFTGMSRIEQHRYVYNVLGELLKGEMHAVNIKTRAI